MIQEYFGLTDEPFGKDILPEHLYLSYGLKSYWPGWITELKSAIFA